MAMQAGLFTALIIPSGYLLINGEFGFPKLGASGLGISSIIASWSSALLTMLYFLTSKKYNKYVLISSDHTNMAISLLDMMKRGVPIGVQSTVETLYTVIISLLMGRISTEAVSACEPVWTYAIFITPITMSIAMQTSLFVKESLTKQRFINARRYGYVSFLVGEVIPLINMVLCFTIPKPMLSLFMNVDNPDNTSIVKMASSFLQISSAALVADGIRLNAGGALRGYDDTTFSMVTGVSIVLIFGSILSSVLDLETSLGAYGLLLGRTIAFIFSALIMLLYWNKKSNVVVNEASLIAEKKQGLSSNILSCFRYIFFNKSASNDEERRSLLHEDSYTDDDRVLCGPLSRQNFPAK